MVCCAAINCHNHNRKVKLSFYRFPSDPDRRKKWLINCRRQQWIPKSSDRLCKVHFESSQFEKNLQNTKKLKPNAVPTIFNVKNPPPLFNPLPRLSIYKNAFAAVDKKELLGIPINEPTVALVQENSSLSPEKQVQLLLEENKKLREKNENTIVLLKEYYEKVRNINEVHQRNARQMEAKLQQKEAYLKKFLNEDQIKSWTEDAECVHL